jgi:hypothetical protein
MSAVELTAMYSGAVGSLGRQLAVVPVSRVGRTIKDMGRRVVGRSAR